MMFERIKTGIGEDCMYFGKDYTLCFEASALLQLSLNTKKQIPSFFLSYGPAAS